MTDASTTGAVERFDPYTDEGNREGYGEMEVQADGEWVRFTDYQAAIQRAEAAEAEVQRLKNIRSAIAEGYNAEAVALEKAVSEALTAQLTVARRAVAAAWSDAIEADWAVYERTGRGANGSGAAAIRALRRAAPTEGEA